MLESDYIHAAPPKPPPPIPVRVSRRSQLTAALRQHARPIVIEDPELARPVARLLRARQLRLWALGSVSQTRCPTPLVGPTALTSRRIGTSPDTSCRGMYRR